MASQKELDKLSEEMLNPNSPLFEIVAKKGLDEVLGADYNPSKKSIAQIKKDIMRIGKNKGGLIYPMNEGGKVGELSSPQISITINLDTRYPTGTGGGSKDIF